MLRLIHFPHGDERSSPFEGGCVGGTLLFMKEDARQCIQKAHVIGRLGIGPVARCHGDRVLRDIDVFHVLMLIFAIPLALILSNIDLKEGGGGGMH